MLTPERHQRILQYLEEHRFARIQDLVDLTEASESTIRRDLKELEQEKKLRRVHGGAAWPERKGAEPTFAQKEQHREQEKSAIARFAAGLVTPGDSLFLDAGSTTLRMIPHLPKNVVVVTNGVNTALTLIEYGIKAITVGGVIKPGTLAAVGSGAIHGLKAFRFDKCFLGINGVHREQGLTTPDPEEAFVKRCALELSDERYVLADSSKFGQVSFAHVCWPGDVTLITDGELPDEELQVWNDITRLEVV